MARRDRLLREHLRERFVVTLKTGETFDGLLGDHDESNLQLIDPYMLSERGRAGVDGDLYLPRIQIAYMQRAGDVL